jgi:hypothetical protein
MVPFATRRLSAPVILSMPFPTIASLTSSKVTDRPSGCGYLGDSAAHDARPDDAYRMDCHFALLEAGTCGLVTAGVLWGIEASASLRKHRSGLQAGMSSLPHRARISSNSLSSWPGTETFISAVTNTLKST